MDLILREVKNDIGEIELGDVFWVDSTNHYYIVVKATSCKFIHYPAKEYRLELVKK